MVRFYSRKTRGEIVFDFFNVILLCLFCLTILYPFWSTIVLSFSDIDNANTLGFKVWIPKWSFTAYQYAFSKYGHVGTAYLNSIFRTIVGTLLGVFMILLAAYPLSKKDIPGRNIMTIYILITMFFSGGLIPTYLLIRNIGLFNSRFALILPVLVQGYYVIIMRNFLMTIDPAFEESAFMDGANYFQILTRIIIPLSKPVIATVALWVAVYHWNEWFMALIYLSSERKIVLQLLLRRMLQNITALQNEEMQAFMDVEDAQLPTQSVRAAITVLTIGPIIFFYPFLQKYFIKGIFLGSLKG
ncbi:MAG: carbohydrate ABC transporter permease [Spirochaetales bacterium]|nr:carbohydrate ABC transporter permease [Spirochaetales bacterium]